MGTLTISVNQRKNGGLGFRLAEEANKSMLSKTTWAIAANPNSFATKFLTAKYGNPLKISYDPIINISYVWKGILSLIDIIRRGACRIIGDGNDTVVWEDPWVQGLHSFLSQPGLNMLTDEPLKVRDLMLFQQKRWNENLVRNLFSPQTAEKILALHRKEGATPDEFVWTGTAHGKHSVKSYYMLEN